jgi:hypothetical protein
MMRGSCSSAIESASARSRLSRRMSRPEIRRVSMPTSNAPTSIAPAATSHHVAVFSALSIASSTTPAYWSWYRSSSSSPTLAAAACQSATLTGSGALSAFGTPRVMIAFSIVDSVCHASPAVSACALVRSRPSSVGIVEVTRLW